MTCVKTIFNCQGPPRMYCTQKSHQNTIAMLEFVWTPFGLSNTGMMFQHHMDSILGDLPHAFWWPWQIRPLTLVTLSLSFPCKKTPGGQPWGVSFLRLDIEFLGHRLTADAISPLPSHVHAIASNLQSVFQASLGLFNFYVDVFQLQLIWFSPWSMPCAAALRVCSSWNGLIRCRPLSKWQDGCFLWW